MALKHNFVSGIADGTDPTLVRPSNWNADHTLSGVGTTSVLFESSTSIAGDTGFTYAGSGQATLALGTITANAKAINVTGTWNNAAVTFDAPIFANITNTASATLSQLMDLQVGGTTAFSVGLQSGTAYIWGNVAPTANNWLFTSVATGTFVNAQSTTQKIQFTGGNTNTYGAFDGGSTQREFRVGADLGIGWSSQTMSGTPGSTGADTRLFRDAAAQVLALGNGTNATTFRVYNTTDQTATNTAPTNFERGVFDWTTTANQLTIGSSAGGTGSFRSVLVGAALGQGNETSLKFDLSIPEWRCFAGGTQAMIVRAGQIILGVSSGLALGNAPIFFGGASNTSLTQVAVQVLGVGDGSGFDANGWLNWGGEQRTTSPTTYTSNTTLSTILTANVQAGRTYSFEIYIPVTASLNVGGIKAALAGTATVTNMIADGRINSNNAIVGQAQVTSLTTVVSAVGGAATGYAEIHGTITVNAAGTFLVQTAQNSTSATATVVGQGARLIMHDMP